MPGIIDSTRPKGSYISPWAIYRASLSASDNLGSPGLVSDTIDLSKSFNGIDSEIWICPVLDAGSSGSGSLTLTLVLANNGSLAIVQPYRVESTTSGATTMNFQKFAGLLAGVYRVLVTVSAGDVWDLHYAIVSRGKIPSFSGGPTQVVPGNVADPNVAGIVPNNPTQGAFYYQENSATINFWVWSITNQNWSPGVTP